ncbi:thiol reductant ABC exporter subunit CydC [Brevibacterium linens]|uniref:ABC transporter, CydDC cysteine exporter (CydDC-E) family, permease/ATP-binding protein CydC n=1 Tax=Brevibacterium linens TaxID=1703 RepID=A0A0B8ZZB2_BRELN|nr:thiol reductant ABC exporter subunit CydC [Brevibacterium linens]KHS51639.1 ABC transporter, CydDC cysteine exporter (CydDC-E) family, permease/ATP-binding protein CydC [Brevibacterium linens]
MSSPLSILLELPTGRRGLALSVLSALCRAVGIVLIAEALVRAIIDHSAPGLWVVLGVLGALLRGGGLWLDRSLGTRLAAESKRGLRLSILSGLLRGRGRPRTNAAVTVTRGIDDLDDYFTTVVPALTAAAVVPIVLLVRIVFSDVLSAVIIAVCLPLVPMFMVLIGRYTAESTSETMAALERLSDHLAELAEGLPVLIGLGRSRDHARRLRELGERYHQANLATLRIAFLSSLALELIATISVALVAVVIGLRLVNGTMDLGDGLLVLLIAPECFIPLRELGAGYHASENGREARERARSLVSETQAAEPAFDISGRLGEQRVLYTDGTIITWSGTIDAGPGVTTISGRSGTGKTTVLGALVGSLPADAHTTADPLTAAYVPQAPRMFAETIGAELNLFGLDDDRARTALSAAGLPTDLRVQTAALSPGQQRRLALVRVQHRLGDGADVLVLDEPTAHLDEDNADIVINLIAEAAATHRVILASHDERVRALSDTEIRPEKTRISAVEGAEAMASTATATEAAPATATADRGRTGNAEAPAVNSWDESSSADERTSSGDEPVIPPMDEGQPDAEKQQSRGESWTATLRRRWSILNSSLPLFTPTMLVAALTACASSLAAIALTAVSAWLIVEASYQPPIMLLMVAIVGVRFFGLSRSVLLYASRLKLHSAIFAALTRLRTRLWEHFERVGMSDRRLLTSDSALRAMVADADDVRDLVPRTLFPPFVSALVVIGVSITAALLDVSALGWFILLGAVNLVIVPTLVIQAESRLALGIREDRNRILSVLTRALHAKDDLRTNRVESRVLGLLAGLESDLEAKQKASARNFGLAQLWLQLSTFTTAVILAASSGAPTEIVAVLSLMALGLGEVFASALEAFRQLPGLGTALDCLPDPDSAEDSGADASALSVSEAEATASDIDRSGRDSPDGSAPADELVGVDALEFEKITVGWDDNTVVSGLDLEAERGGWTVLCGDSGTGKTTSLSVLLRFLDPWSGSYRARDRNGTDHDMLTRSPEDLVGRIAWCPQEAHVFRSTVRGNLALAQRSVPGDDEMFSALRAAGLSDWACAGGLDRWVGDHGTEISGGQRQRLAVARTLLTGADVIVLDEPTAHLDDETARALIDDLRGSLRDRTVVMVTHDRRLITDGDEVVDLGTRVPEAEASRV